MKRILNILLLLVVAVSLCSCEADAMADFEQREDEFVIDYGTVLITNGNGNCFYTLCL